MMFGVVGTLLMLFAWLLSARKKMIRARLGSLSWWLKGHLWLGALSLPMILFHSAFRWGGWLEIVLWLALGAVITSGLIGLALQNMLPRMMKVQLPDESVPDQFAEVCGRLTLSADEKVMTECTAAVVGAAAERPADTPASAYGNPLDWLASFHIHTVRPYLSPVPPNDSPLSSAEQAQLLFDRVRTLLPYTCQETVDWLEQACSDRRHLAQQQRLYQLLHGWLKIHIPCSVALLVFTVVHIATALYF